MSKCSKRASQGSRLCWVAGKAAVAFSGLPTLRLCSSGMLLALLLIVRSMGVDDMGHWGTRGARRRATPSITSWAQLRSVVCARDELYPRWGIKHFPIRKIGQPGTEEAGGDCLATRNIHSSRQVARGWGWYTRALFPSTGRWTGQVGSSMPWRRAAYVGRSAGWSREGGRACSP